MKKFLACALALTFTSAMFASCGSSDDSSSKSEATTTTTTVVAAAKEDTTTTVVAAAKEDTTATETTTSETTDALESSMTDSGTDDFITVESDGNNTIFTLGDSSSETYHDESFPFMGLLEDDDGTVSEVRCYIDAKSLEKDKDLQVKVEFEWTEHYIDMVNDGARTVENSFDNYICPSFANCGDYMVSNDIKCDYPIISVTSADDKLPDVFVKYPFIYVNKLDVTQVEFTISAETVNKMIESASSKFGWEGLDIRLAGNGNFVITKVTVDEPNVQLAWY